MDTNDLKILVATCKNLKALYVEDNDTVRFETTKILSIYFSCVEEAIDGKSGLEKFKNNNFDIVFTDINMPKIDGLSMIKKIRKIDPKIPIVIFSAYDNTEYFLEAIDYGVDGYILKPFRLNDIQKVMTKIVSKLADGKKVNKKIKLINNFVWDKKNKILIKSNKKIDLTKKETLLLVLLSSLTNKIVSSEEIENELFNDNYSDNKRVRSLLSRFHLKVGCDLIKSIYAQGYKLNLEKNIE